MGLVVKVTPATDLYVVWSSVVESLEMWGKAAEVVDHLVEIDREKEEYARPRAEAAIRRADEHGSSAGYAVARWDSDSVAIFEQRGILPRANLPAFLASFDEATERFDLSLLEPFDDETAVHGYDDDTPGSEACG